MLAVLGTTFIVKFSPMIRNERARVMKMREALLWGGGISHGPRNARSNLNHSITESVWAQTAASVRMAVDGLYCSNSECPVRMMQLMSLRQPEMGFEKGFRGLGLGLGLG